MTNYRKVKPCGMLYTFGREYFLLHPYPLAKDSWQHDGAYRFVVVPRKQLSWVGDEPLFPIARHIVSTAYTVDYVADMPEIYIDYAGEYDVANTNRLEMPQEPAPELKLIAEMFAEAEAVA